MKLFPCSTPVPPRLALQLLLVLGILAGNMRAAHAGGPVIVTDENGVPTITDESATPEGADATDATAPHPRASRSAVRNALPRTRDDETYDAIILGVAERYDVSPALLKAVCLVESAMNAGAVGPGGAMGLMQLTRATARTLGVSNPFDPQQAIDGGARYLGHLIDEFGSVPAALAAYKNGPRTVRDLGGRVPSDSATWEYIERVMMAYNYFQKQNPVGAQEEAR
jgi:soluble lytic murein transglycosylase-like protein